MRRAKYNKGKKAPAFIRNLFNMLQQREDIQLIRWTDDEQSFVISNIPKFSQTMLPKYYKHANYSSFVRQLNMYNFNKMRSQNDRQHIFKNELFFKSNEQNLRNIKRREITGKITNNMFQLANNIQEQFQQQNLSPIQPINPFESQNSQSQMLLIAAPSEEYKLRNFPSYQGIRFTQQLQNYLQSSEKAANSVPPMVRIKYPQLSKPIKGLFQEIKSKQNQLEQICIGLYKQNQHLTVQNKRLQHNLGIEFKRKQQILNQIIKYVINFLRQFKEDGQNILFKNNMKPEQQIWQQDIILNSYNIAQKNCTIKNNKFSKYAQNENKILLTLLKQIQKSYNQNNFYRQNVIETSRQQSIHKSNTYHTNGSQQSSQNNFLISMLLKFIQSNNLSQVIERFSLLMNLERNKKNKNFTFVNCMKDLRQHFQRENLFSQSNDHKSIITKGRKIYNQHSNHSIDQEFIDKSKFLQHEKQQIYLMEKQLSLITKAEIILKKK